ncbi:Homeobox domain containing protein [Neofusicoccum parvum]|uniref:Homeobox domain containing protein n=1 Tax=Neofusicoccum parvum TaxID=310453 RepID=A0ACB5S7E3_9PEZI|nr:Homeobox domain containing protein [Neofusicoccum parvum]
MAPGPVSDLRDVFEKRCHFTTETVELGLGNAAEDLDFAVHGFVHKHDDPLNLLIIYYAGHGFFHRSKKLLQLAGSDADQIRGIKFPTVYWNDAEKHLTKSSRNSDVLAIMDCCFASDMMRSCGENSRVFELLAASHIGQVTEQPGEHSFTRALINSLNYLLDNNDGDGSFDSHQLHEEINRRRIENPSGLWRRLPGNSRHILLRRQRLEAEMHVADAEAPPGPDASGGLLSLQFFLKNNQLSKETIEELTRLLPKSFSSCDAPVRNIKWLGFGSTSRAKSFAGIVKEIMRNKRHKNKQDEEKTSDTDGAYESSDAGKRKADDVTIADAVLHKKPRHVETTDESSEASLNFYSVKAE